MGFCNNVLKFVELRKKNYEIEFYFAKKRIVFNDCILNKSIFFNKNKNIFLMITSILFISTK